MIVGIKRIFDKAEITDGKRVLVDRLWPRGVKKSTANIDLWLKDIAPSNELRKWFAHEPEKWGDFRSRYRKELEENISFAELLELVKASDVTLIYAAKDTAHNNAVVLEELVKEKMK